MTKKRYSELSRAGRRRMVTASLLRSALSVTLLVVVYYLVPLDRPLDAGTWIEFTIGLVVFAMAVAWQVQAIIGSDLPRLRAIQAVATGLPLLLLLYASAYVLIANDQPDSFTEALSRTDSLYFTVTVFATVGFGDIAPRTELARIVTTTQMLMGLVAVGLVAKVLLGAVQVAVQRRATEQPEPPAAQTAPPSHPDETRPGAG
jgi:voltage-gated potassium channel